MLIKFILIFISLYKISYSIYVLQPKTFFEYVDEGRIEKYKLDNIIEKISKGFEEVYGFYTLANNPPKTEYEDVIFEKVNITEELSHINTANRNYYNFYQDFSRVFGKVKDGHTSIIFKNLNNFTKVLYEKGASIYFPVIFYIKNDTNGVPKVYCKKNKNETLNQQFVKKEEIFSVIEKNQEYPVKTIKGKSPFEYIDDLITPFIGIRSVHGSFTQSLNLINKLHIGIVPVEKENVIDFEVEYENGDHFKTDILFIFKENLFQNKHSLTPLASIQNYYLNPDAFDKMINEFIFIPEIKEFPYDLIKIDKYSRFKLNLETNINSIQGTSMTQKDWNYQTSDEVLKCREDNENKLNVYLVKSFAPKYINEFIDTVEKCSKLFDKNDNKIIVIHSFNGGGYVVLAEFLLSMVSPYTSINLYTRIRATPAIKKEFRYVFNTIEGCEEQSQLDFFDKFENVSYGPQGNEVYEDLTKSFLMVDGDLREKAIDLRKKMVRKRKPTEIMVFTDGYSFSATSMFTKYLQYYGGGIVVGYFGNPSKNTTFDSSLSPSGIITIDQLFVWNKNFDFLKTNYLTELQFAILQSFYNKNDSKIPLEFVVTPVDERISLYENFNESNYHIFVQKAKEIFAKYENECSTVNPNLFLMDDNCSSVHGGYPCVNGKWDKSKCVQFYCDLGFIYDKQTKSCIEDKCKAKSIAFRVIIIILMAISSLTIIAMIVYCSCICCCYRKRKIAPSESLL